MHARDHAVALLEFTRSYSLNLLKDFPESKWTHQPSPTDNHVLWVMGHTAGTDAWIGGLLGFDAKVSKAVIDAYGQGSKPGPTGNPPVAEVKAAFESSRAALLAWLKSANDAALSKNLVEATGGFVTDPIDAAFKMAWHEGFHFGQVANVRKALSLKPTI